MTPEESLYCQIMVSSDQGKVRWVINPMHQSTLYWKEGREEEKLLGRRENVLLALLHKYQATNESVSELKACNCMLTLGLAGTKFPKNMQPLPKKATHSLLVFNVIYLTSILSVTSELLQSSSVWVCTWR